MHFLCRIITAMPHDAELNFTAQINPIRSTVLCIFVSVIDIVQTVINKFVLLKFSYNRETKVETPCVSPLTMCRLNPLQRIRKLTDIMFGHRLPATTHKPPQKLKNILLRKMSCPCAPLGLIYLNRLVVLIMFLSISPCWLSALELLKEETFNLKERLNYAHWHWSQHAVLLN